MPHSAPPQDAVSVIAQEFLVDEPCSVAVDVPGAHVRMRPGPQPDRVEVDISVSGCPPEMAEDILNRMKVGTQQMKDTVRVYGDGDQSDAVWWRWVRRLDVTVHVNLRLPTHVEADLRVPGGEIDIADLKGHVDLKVMGGPCRAHNLEGTLDVRAESSDVSIDGFSGEQIIARVAVGSLTVNDVQAHTMTLRSVAAPVTLTNVEGSTTLTANSTSVEIEALKGPVTARCQGGDCTYTGAPTHDAELTVVGSTLTLRLPSDHPADLTMIGDTLSLDEAFAFEGDRADHEITGHLNDGGHPLTLRAIGGTAHCRPS
jgi:hypothetical protein